MVGEGGYYHSHENRGTRDSLDLFGHSSRSRQGSCLKNPSKFTEGKSLSQSGHGHLSKTLAIICVGRPRLSTVQREPSG